jgi:DNA-binding transcriptional MerR regulator
MAATEETNDSLELFHPLPGSVYSLETVVHLTGASRRSILVYCKSGLVRPQGDPETDALSFDEEGIYQIRQIEHLRSRHGINLAGIQIIFELLSELRHLHEEMRFLRS